MSNFNKRRSIAAAELNVGKDYDPTEILAPQERSKVQSVAPEQASQMLDQYYQDKPTYEKLRRFIQTHFNNNKYEKGVFED